MYYALKIIFVLNHQWTVIYSLFVRHILHFTLDHHFCTLHTNVYNAHKVLSWQSQIIYICKPYLFFHIYDPLHIPCLAVILVFFQIIFIKVVLHFITFHFWEPYLFFHIYDNLWINCFVDHLFFLFYANIFLIVHTWVYIQNTNAHEVLSLQLQYFIFVSHICSLTSITHLVFHVWKSHLFFAYLYEVSTAIHKIFFIWQSYLLLM